MFSFRPVQTSSICMSWKKSHDARDVAVHHPTVFGRGFCCRASDIRIMAIAMSAQMMHRTELTAAQGINGQVKCEGCGDHRFFIGLKVDLVDGRNTIRVVECAACARQQLMVPQLPSILGRKSS